LAIVFDQKRIRKNKGDDIDEAYRSVRMAGKRST